MANYAISDIHGCINTFRYALENRIGLRKSDTLYLLGDYVNKGPDSKAVLDYMLQLIESGYTLKCIRGNHDQVLLDALDTGNKANWLTKPDQKKLLANFQATSFNTIDQKYIRFIRSLPLYIKLKRFLLVHAGCDFSFPKENLLNDPYTLLNIKVFKADSEKLVDVF